jgi:hypothetical protein
MWKVAISQVYRPLQDCLQPSPDSNALVETAGKFCNSLTDKSFSVGYDEEKQTIVTSRPVMRSEFKVL